MITIFNIIFGLLIVVTLGGALAYRLKDYKEEKEWKKIIEDNTVKPPNQNEEKVQK